MSSEDFTKTLDLVRRAQDGDGEALNRLFDRYQDRVRRIVRIRLGPRLRSRLESADIMQDTFAAAVRRFEDFEMRDDASFIHWLSTIAEHQITDRNDYYSAKKRTAKGEVPMQGADPEAPKIEPPSERTAPLDALIRSEGAELVEECLSALEERHRDLILLRDYAGFSWKDVAERTGRPTADAAREMHRVALVKLAGEIVRRRS